MVARPCIIAMREHICALAKDQSAPRHPLGRAAVSPPHARSGFTRRYKADGPSTFFVPPSSSLWGGEGPHSQALLCVGEPTLTRTLIVTVTAGGEPPNGRLFVHHFVQLRTTLPANRFRCDPGSAGHSVGSGSCEDAVSARLPPWYNRRGPQRDGWLLPRRVGTIADSTDCLGPARARGATSIAYHSPPPAPAIWNHCVQI